MCCAVANRCFPTEIPGVDEIEIFDSNNETVGENQLQEGLEFVTYIHYNNIVQRTLVYTFTILSAKFFYTDCNDELKCIRTVKVSSHIRCAALRHSLLFFTFSNWPLWHIRHCTLASHHTCPNCYNIMNPHGLCDLLHFFNSLFQHTTLNLARVHFESHHQKSGIYCLLVSVIHHHSLHFVGIYKHIIFSQPILNPNDHLLSTRPDSL